MWRFAATGTALALVAGLAPLPTAGEAAGPAGNGRIFYDAESGTGQWRILSVNSRGHLRRRLKAHGIGAMSHPASGPDGALLFQSSGRGGFGDIFVATRDGAEVKRLTSGGDDTRPEFCGRAGRHVVWIRRTGVPNERKVWVMKPDGTQARPISENPWPRSVACSPSGKRLAIATYRGGSSQGGGAGIDITDLQGQAKRRLYALPLGHAAFNLDFSPDGRKLVFDMARTKDPSHTSRVMSLNRHSRRVSGLTAKNGYSYEPSFSPDGKRIAFISQSWHGGSRRLYVMQANGKNPRRLRNAKPSPGDPAWAPPH